jgi:hypothetical protein
LQHKGLIYGSEQGYLVHHASGSTTSPPSALSTGTLGIFDEAIRVALILAEMLCQ